MSDSYKHHNGGNSPCDSNAVVKFKPVVNFKPVIGLQPSSADNIAATKFAYATSDEIRTENLTDGAGDFTILSIPYFITAGETVKLDASVQTGLNGFLGMGNYNVALDLQRNGETLAVFRESGRSPTAFNFILSLSWVDRPLPGTQSYDLVATIIGTQFDTVTFQVRSFAATIHSPMNVLTSSEG